MILSETYAASRNRLLAIAEHLTDAQAGMLVPALPGWTVKDTYAHLAGMCADNLDGRTEGMPGPIWTARQVEERQDTNLLGVCREWADRAGKMDEILSAPHSKRISIVASDAWQHEQDIRGALNLPGARDGEHVTAVVDLTATLFARGWDLPTLRLVGEGGSWLLGTGEPVATLTASDFELARQLIGRRTQAQLLAMDWDGDPAPFLLRLNAFGPPDVELVE